MMAHATRTRPTVYVTITHKQARELRIAAVKHTAEQIGLRWGGVEVGGVIRVYFGEGLCRLRNLPRAERWMKVWKEWYDAGNMGWFEWGTKVFTERTAPSLRKYDASVAAFQERAVGG